MSDSPDVKPRAPSAERPEDECLHPEFNGLVDEAKLYEGRSRIWRNIRRWWRLRS